MGTDMERMNNFLIRCKTSLHWEQVIQPSDQNCLLLASCLHYDALNTFLYITAYLPSDTGLTRLDKAFQMKAVPTQMCLRNNSMDWFAF